MTRSAWVVAVVASVALTLFVGWLQDGGLWQADADIPQDLQQPLRDVQVVWMVERAVFDGIDPSLPLDEIANHVGVPVTRDSILDYHPRLPSGYLLESWVALLPRGHVTSVALIIVGLGLGLVFGLTGVIRGSPIPLFVFPLFVLTDALTSLVFWRSTSWLMAASMLACWALARDGDNPWAGIALVPAIGTRIFPIILVPLLWIKGRRRAATAAIAGTVGLNLAGLALPNISIQSTVRVLTEGKPDFLASYGNGSVWAVITRPGGHIAWALLLSVTLIVGFLWFSRGLGFDLSYGIGLAVGLVATPVAWSHFRLALIPLVVNPLGVGVWLLEVGGVLVFEWRWLTGLAASVAAGLIWLTSYRTPRTSREHTLSDTMPLSHGRGTTDLDSETP